MAVKKATKKGSTAIVPWSEKFAAYAKEAKAQVASIGSGTSIKFGRGSISVGGLPVKGGKLECVVVGSCALNAWWEAEYDKDDVQPPDCYAFSMIVGDSEMGPHEKCENPQSENCATCEKNQFGTSRTGKGKACANCVRLGILTSKDCEDSENIARAELGIGRVSPTNLKHWASYVKSLEDVEGGPFPPWAVVTEISSFDDPDTQIRLEFRMVEVIEDDDVLAELEKRALKVQDVLQQPYGPRIKKAAKPAARSVAGKSKKFAGGKPAGRR